MSLFRNKKIFLLLCCGTYMCAYLCRTNLSSALDKLGAALSVTPATLGLMGTAYFFVYACFQLVSGFIGDRARPERLMLLGAVGVAAVNIGISLSGSYSAILALWCLNGVFQSMFWGPMSRMLAGRFTAARERLTASTCCSLSMPCGYILSWSVIAPLLADAPWLWYFRIPGLVMLVPMALWAVAAARPEHANPAPASVRKPSVAQLLRTMREERLWLMAVVCVSNGVIKESFTIWAPMILTKLLGLDVKSSALYLVLFPVLNAAFIYANGSHLKRTGSSLCRSLRGLFALVAACAVLLMLDLPGAAPTVVLMAVVSGAGYAENNVLLGVMPMDYADERITSTLVGIFDFSAYIGAGVAAYGLGLLITGSKLRPIAAVWLAAAAAGLAALAFARGRTTRHRADMLEN